MAIPRPSHVTKHTHANPPGGASENLALAPVLATSKLLGVMENNEETRQKRLARQKRRTKATPNPGFKTTTDNRWCSYVSAVYVSAVHPKFDFKKR
jgi:hypothetical protein